MSESWLPIRERTQVLSTAVAKEISKNIGGLTHYEPLAAFASEAMQAGLWKNIAKRVRSMISRLPITTQSYRPDRDSRAEKSPGVEPQDLPGDCAPFLKHLLSGGGLPEICG